MAAPLVYTEPYLPGSANKFKRHLQLNVSFSLRIPAANTVTRIALNPRTTCHRNLVQSKSSIYFFSSGLIALLVRTVSQLPHV